MKIVFEKEEKVATPYKKLLTGETFMTVNLDGTPSYKLCMKIERCEESEWGETANCVRLLDGGLTFIDLEERVYRVDTETVINSIGKD
jgi:hypothetical protein